MALTAGFSLGGAAVLGGHLIQHRDALGAGRDLQNVAVAVVRQVDAHLLRHLDAVRALASGIEEEPVDSTPALRKLLERVHGIYPTFLTMLVARRDGQMIAGHPQQDRQGNLLRLPLPVGDREYFRQPMATGQPYVSGAFRGRGYGTDPIVAVSAPVLDAQGRAVGVVEGSLDLTRLRHVEGLADHARFDVLIVDASTSIVYASTRTGYSPLQDVRDEPVGRALKDQSSRPMRYVVGDATYWAAAVETKVGGWWVVVQQSDAEVTAATRGFLWTMGAALLVTLALAAGLAAVLARTASRPLEALQVNVGQFLSGGRPPVIEVPVHAPREIADLVAGFHELERRTGRTLAGLLPVCAWCRRIRDDQGGWHSLERYIEHHTAAAVTHGICDECLHRIDEGGEKGP